MYTTYRHSLSHNLVKFRHIISHGKGHIAAHPSSINFGDSKGLHCGSKLIFLFFSNIIALALKEHSPVYNTSICYPRWGLHWKLSNCITQNGDSGGKKTQNKTGNSLSKTKHDCDASKLPAAICFSKRSVWFTWWPVNTEPWEWQWRALTCTCPGRGVWMSVHGLLNTWG